MRLTRIWAPAVLAVAVSLIGCSKQSTGTPGASKPLPPGEKVKIGFLVKMPDEPWFQDEWKFAQKAADQYGFQLFKIGAPDGEKVLTAIDNLASNGAQGFVICTPDVKLGPAIKARADQHGLKVYSVDDQFVGADGQFMDVPYMGISARKIGEEVGKALYAEYTKRGWTPENTAAMAITFDELNTVKERSDGATEALVKAGFPASRIFRGPTRVLNVPGAFDAANVVLTQHADVKNWLVFSVNDEGVLGGVRALEGRGFKSDRVVGIGIGGSTAFAEWEKPEATGFHGTVLISPLRHGFETSERLYKWIKDGEEAPKVIYTEGIPVDKQSFKKIAREQGLLD